MSGSCCAVNSTELVGAEDAELLKHALSGDACVGRGWTQCPGVANHWFYMCGRHEEAPSRCHIQNETGQQKQEDVDSKARRVPSQLRWVPLPHPQPS